MAIVLSSFKRDSLSQKRLASIVSDESGYGLDFEKVKTVRYIADPTRSDSAPSIDALRTELVRQRDSVVLESGALLNEGFTEDGRLVASPELRLTENAFSDICNVLQIPTSFVHKFAKVNRQSALAMVNDFIRDRGEDRIMSRRLVLDGDEQTVHAVVSEDVYAKINNVTLLDDTLSSSSDTRISRALLEGLSLRFTTVSEKFTHEPKKGDVIRGGINVSNSIGGRSAVVVAEYWERLVCTNGAVATQDGHRFVIPHRGDLAYDNTVSSIMQVSEVMDMYRKMSSVAACQRLEGDDIQLIHSYLTHRKNAGSVFADMVTARAVEEAMHDKRGTDDLRLWDFANATTSLSHMAASMKRTEQLEAIGYDLVSTVGDHILDN